MPPSVQDWLPKGRKIDENKELLPIKCVHEMQQVGITEVMTLLACDDDGRKYDEFLLQNISIAPMESAALFEFFSHIKDLRILKIYRCTMEQSAYRELSSLLKKGNKISSLTIQYCRMSDNDNKQVIDALRNENCNVTHLDLAYDNLTAESTKFIRDTFKK